MTTDTNKLWLRFTRWFHEMGSPRFFFTWAHRFEPWFAGVAFILLTIGLFWGLFIAPPDYQQGDSYRIIFIHVPAASLAMSIYALMAIAGAVFLVWRIKMANLIAEACAPLGASFTFLALVTGAIWGKPTWGTWWVWDARLTSMLILLFLYIGLMVIRNAMPDTLRASRAAALLALVGLINLPIIKYSVEWWNTLHQGPTFRLTEKPAMPASMWLPLLVSFIGHYCWFGWALMRSARLTLLDREQHARWLDTWINDHNAQGAQ